MTPQSEYLLRFASTRSLTFPLPLSLLFLSFLPLFFLSSSLLLTSISTHIFSLPFFPSSFLLSRVPFTAPVPFYHHLLYCHFLPCHLPACHVFCCSFSFCFLCNRPPLCQSHFVIILAIALLFRSLFLSSLSIPSVSLVILISIPFTISVSLANSAVRQSTFQHPKHCLCP